MEAEFWHERWEKGQIGFHKHEYNNHMQAFINHLTGSSRIMDGCVTL